MCWRRRSSTVEVTNNEEGGVAYLQALNHTLFLALNAGPHPPGWLLTPAFILAQALVWLLPLLLLSMWYWGGRRQRGRVLFVLAVAVLGFLLKLLINALWPQLRPFQLGLGSVYLMPPLGPSFPSGHASAFFCVGWALWCAGERAIGAIVLLAALGVAWARIYLGVHFPLDMAGAAGLAWLSQWLLAPLWRRHGEVLLRWVLRERT